MATTTTALSPRFIHGRGRPGDLYLVEIPVQLSGTYLTGTKPSFNILTALLNAGMGIASCKVKAVFLFRDFYDGTTRYTAPNAQISLSTLNSGCTNDVVTFRVDATDSTHANGDTNTEVADATSLVGFFSFIALLTEVDATI